MFSICFPWTLQELRRRPLYILVRVDHSGPHSVCQQWWGLSQFLSVVFDCFFFFFSVKVFCCWAACFLPGEQAFTVVRFVVLCAPIGISGFSDSFSSESGIVEAKISPGNSLLYCFLGVFQLCLFLNNISGL